MLPTHIPTTLSLDQLVGSSINGSFLVRKTDNIDSFFTILLARNSVTSDKVAARSTFVQAFPSENSYNRAYLHLLKHSNYTYLEEYFV